MVVCPRTLLMPGLASVTLVGIGACAATFTYAADSKEITRLEAVQVLDIVEQTLLFQDGGNHVPQVEYFNKEGMGAIWLAGDPPIGKKVFHVTWRLARDDKKQLVFCYEVKPSDVKILTGQTVTQNAKACARPKEILDGIRDHREGDTLKLLGQDEMPVVLTRAVASLGDVDGLLEAKQ